MPTVRVTSRYSQTGDGQQASIACGNLATAKSVPPDKYAGKYKISMLNRVTMIRLTVREFEKRYGLEGVIDANIIDVSGKLLMGILDIKMLL